MDYWSLVDIGVACGIALGAKHELGKFKEIVNGAITALQANLKELTTREAKQDAELLLVKHRLTDLEETMGEVVGGLRTLHKALTEEDEDDEETEVIGRVVGFHRQDDEDDE